MPFDATVRTPLSGTFPLGKHHKVWFTGFLPFLLVSASLGGPGPGVWGRAQRHFPAHFRWKCTEKCHFCVPFGRSWKLVLL